jgi:hypothetical protein
LDHSLLVYQSLFYQASINREKLQSVLILDASLPESQLAMQILSKQVGIRTIVATIDQFDMQKVLQEEFPQAHIIFTPSEKNIEKAFAVTCGLGFDLILDYSGLVETNRR